MIVVVIVLCAVALFAVILVVVTRQRLAAQRRLTAAADLLATRRAVEIEDRDAALREAEQQGLEAGRRADEAAAAAERAAEQQLTATAQAEAAIAASVQAELAAGEALAARAEAELRADAADRRAAEASSIGVDPHVLWALERQRSDRTWRFSVAIGPEGRSVFDDVEHPLIEALRVEVAATKEEAGTIVELDVDLPVAVTSAGSLLTLRAAQELLAGVVRLAEEVVLSVRHDGGDVVVTIDAKDEHGEPIEAPTLDTPPSLGLATVPGGVRVIGAVGAVAS